MEFITLAKTDPEFNDYLLGTFSRTHRALPVETFHAETSRERVTFRLMPLEAVQKPAWWLVYFRSCRPELLALTMGPAVGAWLNHRLLLAQWARWPSWFALAGIFFLHTGAFLFNDVQDHLRGMDRLNRRRGSQVIQKGWVRAIDMRRWAVVNLALAVLFGVPAFLNAPGALSLVCAVALVALLTITERWGSRWGLCDLAVVLLFGPLLTSGIALASFARLSASDVILGFAFGWSALWVFQSRHFEDLFRSRPRSARTFLGFWDFDRARRIILGEGLLLFAIMPVCAWALHAPLKALAVLPLAGVPLLLTLNQFWRAASPLSSSLVRTRRWVLSAHLAWTIWWVLALGVSWL